MRRITKVYFGYFDLEGNLTDREFGVFELGKIHKEKGNKVINIRPIRSKSEDMYFYVTFEEGDEYIQMAERVEYSRVSEL